MYYYEPLSLTPEPTLVPDETTYVLNLSMIGHRSSDFEAVAEETFNHLKSIFGTEDKVMIFTSNGTSVLEVSMLNIVNPEDHSVVIVSGAFGNRFKQIAETYYGNIHAHDRLLYTFPSPRD